MIPKRCYQSPVVLHKTLRHRSTETKCEIVQVYKELKLYSVQLTCIYVTSEKKRDCFRWVGGSGLQRTMIKHVHFIPQNQGLNKLLNSLSVLMFLLRMLSTSDKCSKTFIFLRGRFVQFIFGNFICLCELIFMLLLLFTMMQRHLIY